MCQAQPEDLPTAVSVPQDLEAAWPCSQRHGRTQLPPVAIPKLSPAQTQGCPPGMAAAAGDRTGSAWQGPSTLSRGGALRGAEGPSPGASPPERPRPRSPRAPGAAPRHCGGCRRPPPPARAAAARWGRGGTAAPGGRGAAPPGTARPGPARPNREEPRPAQPARSPGGAGRGRRGGEGGGGGGGGQCATGWCCCAPVRSGSRCTSGCCSAAPAAPGGRRQVGKGRRGTGARRCGR